MKASDRESGGAEVRPEDSPVWQVVLYRGARDNTPKPREWDAATMCRALAHHRVWTGAKVDAPAWSPVTFNTQSAKRRAALVESVTMLVLDCDAGEPLDTLEGLGDEFVRLGHTSWSHSTHKPKARLVFPFDPARPCPVEKWEAVWGAASRWAAAHGVTVDAATKDPSRLYFGPYIPPDITAKEEADAWIYGPERGTGVLPDRPRRFLSWARLATSFPPPEEEEPVVDFVKATAGSVYDTEDRHQRRRAAFASGLVASRARKLATAGKGGRNSSLFGAARLVAQLEAAGALDGGAALAELATAANQAGLDAKEIRRTLASGYAAGGADPAYDIDREMGA